MTARRRRRLTPEERRTRRLASHRRYNLSAKGKARDARYEAKHPERALRWEAARNAARAVRAAA